MTVIVYSVKDNEIGFDSRLSGSNGVIYTDDLMKARFDGDDIFIFTGSIHNDDEFIDAYRNNKEVSDDNDNCCYLINNNSKSVKYLCVHNKKIIVEPLTYNDAIGSGRSHAITAIDLGFDVVDAVKCSIKRDSRCGGTIRLFKYDDIVGEWVLIDSED